MEKYLNIKIINLYGKIQKTFMCRKGKDKFPSQYLNKFLTKEYQDTPIWIFPYSKIWMDITSDMNHFGTYLYLFANLNLKYLGADTIVMFTKIPPCCHNDMERIHERASRLAINHITYTRAKTDLVHRMKIINWDKRLLCRLVGWLDI